VDRHGFLGTVFEAAPLIADAHQPQMPHRIGMVAKTSTVINAVSQNAFPRSPLTGGVP
jgi:hypothetical protein